MEKLKAQSAVDDAAEVMQTANVKEQAATNKAKETQDGTDVTLAINAKNRAAAARDKHTALRSTLSDAEGAAQQALAEAQAAGATLNLPSLPPTIGEPPAPVEEPLAPINEPAATKLSTTLADKKKARLLQERHHLTDAYKQAKAEKEVADKDLQNTMGALTAQDTKVEEFKSAKTAARKEQMDMHLKLEAGIEGIAQAKDELDEVKKQEMKAQAFVEEARVEEKVASADAETSGGDDDDLEKSEEERAEVDDGYKRAKAELVARKLALVKIEAAIQAAKRNVEVKKDAVITLREELGEADARYATSDTEIKHATKEEGALKLDEAEAQDAQKTAKKHMGTAHALAHAAQMSANNDKTADMATRKALLGDSEAAEYEALKKVKDHDGLSTTGQDLVAKDGVVSSMYMSKFKEIPLPKEGSNPILEAEATAAVQDKTGDDPDMAAFNRMLAAASGP